MSAVMKNNSGNAVESVKYTYIQPKPPSRTGNTDRAVSTAEPNQARTDMISTAFCTPLEIVIA